MLAASSPVNYPDSQSPPRVAHYDDGHAQPKQRKRPNGPFLIEEEDEDDGDSHGQESGVSDAPGKPGDINGASTMARNTSDSSIRNATSKAPSPKRRMLHDIRQNGPETMQASEATQISGAISGSQPNNTEHGILPNLDLSRSVFSSLLKDKGVGSSYKMTTCKGRTIPVATRETGENATYESMVGARSKTKEGRATRSYYGIDLHDIVKEARKELAAEATIQTTTGAKQPLPTTESSAPKKGSKKTLLWTEKFRARNFMDLCGDDGTNRMVLRWLKRWDPVVFPGMAKSKPVIQRRPAAQNTQEEKPHRKILLLAGPPGLGKTTLAHVCARQAGYDVMEINASDDRSRDVVKNRIRTSLGTESVKTVRNRKADGGPAKTAKPACVVVDEVDGVVTGSGGSGEGGFIKALIDLILVDQQNSSAAGTYVAHRNRKKKGDDFRMMRPLILICNDVYHPSLRPLRQSNLAEIIHVGRPQMDAVVGRLKSVFEKEGIPCEKDAARKLCEAAWGMTSGIDAKRGSASTVEGDLRGVMVVGEWVAGRFRSSVAYSQDTKLTKHWIESNIIHDLKNGAAGSRGLGRGSVKDIVGRLFQEGGGFPKQAMNLSESKNKHEQPQTKLGLGEQHRKYAMERLQQMVDTSGEIGHVITEIFAEYPSREYNDDLYLTKPNQAYEWLHFHDECQARLYASQEWELAPYLSQPVLAWHLLFASPKRHQPAPTVYEKRFGNEAEEPEEPPLPFSGPRGDFQAFEAEKHNRAQLQEMQCQLNPTMMRLFRSAEDMAMDFLPYLIRMVSPDVKPVVVGGSQGSTASVRKESEREMVRRAADVLAEVNIALVKGKIETDNLANNNNPQFVYRMEPDLDALVTYETGTQSQAPTRFAVRQVLDQELQKSLAQKEAQARQARFRAGGGPEDDLDAASSARASRPTIEEIKAQQAGLAQSSVKRDFFGRPIEVRPVAAKDEDGEARRTEAKKENVVWVTYHEGLNNAVRKPLSLQEFLGGL